jgi:hypothetical protein
MRAFINIEEAEFGGEWITLARGEIVKKLNTHQLYQLAIVIHPLVGLAQKDCTVGDILWPMFRAHSKLSQQIKEGIFSPSLKRAAAELMRSFNSRGLPESIVDIFDVDNKKPISAYEIGSLSRAASDFETVLANELPGLATYFVSQQGLYATDDLISQAVSHIPERLRSSVPEKACRDIGEAGKCLAFQLPTACAFHMWRALETMMDRYYSALTGNSFADDNVVRNWDKYITALEGVGAESKITEFLDHIRQEYRNPISHPSETLEQDDAFSLFGTGLSAITQVAKAVVALHPVERERELQGLAEAIDSGALSEPHNVADASAAGGN